uniref:Uncharacterized protein n=1 Tax=Lotharella oceanica TaxID=641309 RepID=A0A7S2TSI2_9EUKA
MKKEMKMRKTGKPNGNKRSQASVLLAPKAGSACLFNHTTRSFYYDGEAVGRGVKYLLRTDAMHRVVNASSSPPPSPPPPSPSPRRAQPSPSATTAPATSATPTERKASAGEDDGDGESMGQRHGVTIVSGGLLAPRTEVKDGKQLLVHQTNCVTRTGAGLATVIFRRHPKANCYRTRKAGRGARASTSRARARSPRGPRPVVNLFGKIGKGMPSAEGTEDSRAKRLEYFRRGLWQALSLPGSPRNDLACPSLRDWLRPGRGQLGGPPGVHTGGASRLPPERQGRDFQAPRCEDKTRAFKERWRPRHKKGRSQKQDDQQQANNASSESTHAVR